jgi:hypothetical protein
MRHSPLEFENDYNEKILKTIKMVLPSMCRFSTYQCMVLLVAFSMTFDSKK